MLYFVVQTGLNIDMDIIKFLHGALNSLTDCKMHGKRQACHHYQGNVTGVIVVKRFQVKNKVIECIEDSFGFLENYFTFFCHLKTATAPVTQHQIQTFF